MAPALSKELVLRSFSLFAPPETGVECQVVSDKLEETATSRRRPGRVRERCFAPTVDDFFHSPLALEAPPASLCIHGNLFVTILFAVATPTAGYDQNPGNSILAGSVEGKDYTNPDQTKPAGAGTSLTGSAPRIFVRAPHTLQKRHAR
jgi:hypothetical protein